MKGAGPRAGKYAMLFLDRAHLESFGGAVEVQN